MAFKDTAQRWLRSGPQAIGIVAGVALLVGAVIGLGAGYKIEKSRTQSDVKRLQQQIKTGGGGTSGKFSQRVGNVTATTPGLVSMSTTKNGTLVVLTTTSTHISQAQKGAIGDVVAGRRVLASVGGHELLVLATDSQLGRTVKTVGKDFIDLASGNGAPAVHLQTKDVKVVDTVASATDADVKKGSEALVGGHAVTKGVFTATELILLTPGSFLAS